MTLTAMRQTPAVTETAWERLYRLVELRRARLGLTLPGVQAVGGPSPKWVQKLRVTTGEPTPRMRLSMLDLDRALQWPEGTTWGLVSDDRSGWSQAILDDEEAQLLDQRDEADHFSYVVAARLRAIPEAQRTEVMRAILDLLDLRR